MEAHAAILLPGTPTLCIQSNLLVDTNSESQRTLAQGKGRPEAFGNLDLIQKAVQSLGEPLGAETERRRAGGASPGGEQHSSFR